MTFLLALTAVAAVAEVANASAFRGNSPAAATGRMSVAELRATVLDELMLALGSGNRVTEQRLGSIEDALRPTFLSMPKNVYGNLDHSSVRYVLHLSRLRYCMFSDTENKLFYMFAYLACLMC